MTQVPVHDGYNTYVLPFDTFVSWRNRFFTIIVLVDDPEWERYRQHYLIPDESYTYVKASAFLKDHGSIDEEVELAHVCYFPESKTWEISPYLINELRNQTQDT